MGVRWSECECMWMNGWKNQKREWDHGSQYRTVPSVQSWVVGQHLFPPVRGKKESSMHNKSQQHGLHIHVHVHVHVYVYVHMHTRFKYAY